MTLLLKLMMMMVTLTGTTMAHKSMKAPTKRGGADIELAMDNETLHWHELTGKQKEQVLESHIFIKQKRDGKIKACKVISGNKQHNHITKEDMSSTMVSAEAVMLTCVIDAQEVSDVAVVGIPNALVQTVVR